MCINVIITIIILRTLSGGNMKINSPLFIATILLLTALTTYIQATNITISIDTKGTLTPISPYIYGTNQELNGDENFTLHRHGGNRWTGYNWETNASNAGTDWHNQSDSYLGGGTTPAGALIERVDSDRTQGYKSLVTIPMAGYVAADKNGPVDTTTETAPSPRWDSLVYFKPSALATTPDTTDNVVYTNEMVHTLVQKYGLSSEGGIYGYLLDNEPGLWSGTHPALHPTPATAVELTQKSVALATSIKGVDSTALTFGPVFYGFSGMYNMQSASDWDSEKGAHTWYVSYYLDKLKQASDSTGKRLLDVLDFHWYSEAKGDQRITNKTATSVADQKERVQAPRSLWDPTYGTSTHHENSWIGQWMYDFLPLIPKIQESIDTYNPGTKISLTEWNFGGESDITGAIATADFLGSMGALGVYAASHWKMWDVTTYTSAGFKLYRNYDGNKATFGSLSVPTNSSDKDSSTAYSAFTDSTSPTLHTIIINKSFTTSQTTTITLTADTTYTQAEIWVLDSTNATITQGATITPTSRNSFSVTIPPLSIYHIVFTVDGTSTLHQTNSEKKGQTMFTKEPHTLRYQLHLATKENVSIQLVDMKGRVVTTLLQKELSIGDHSFLIPSTISQGIYLLSAKIGEDAFSQKVMLP